MTRHFALTLISGDPNWARMGIEAGVDRILVDLEKLGKAERQKGRELFLSSLGWPDVSAVRAVIPKGRLMVRLDPLHVGSSNQVEMAIELGADLLMLPYFESTKDIIDFCKIVRDRVPVVPLLETASSVKDIECLLRCDLIHEFHVGMNDLAIDIGLASHSELWGSDILSDLCECAQRYSKPFGIGGVTDPRCRGLAIDPSWIIAQQVRLGSTSALLGRHFKEQAVKQPSIENISAAVDAIRRCFAGCATDTAIRMRN